METIFEKIKAERKAQDEKWSGPKGGVYHTSQEHDDLHDIEDFFKFIRWQISKYEQEMECGQASYPDTSLDQARERYIKIAALAVAAIESIDRKAKGEQ